MKKAATRAFPRPAHRLWLGIFASWLLLLSGSLARWGAPPGAMQAARLSSLLGSKKQQLSDVQGEIERLEKDAVTLEKSWVAQHREIRRVLGYAAADEIIFDFSDADSL